MLAYNDRATDRATTDALGYGDRVGEPKAQLLCYNVHNSDVGAVPRAASVANLRRVQRRSSRSSARQCSAARRLQRRPKSASAPAPRRTR